MSIEAMTLALDALESRCGTNADERLPGGAIPALRTAISQQTDNAACKSVQKRLASQQPATPSLQAVCRYISDVLGSEAPNGEKHIARTIMHLLPLEQALSGQQPATGEPVKAAPYNPTEEMRWAMKRIDPALSSDQCRALWSAAWSASPSTHPAPSVPDDVVRVPVQVLKDASEALGNFVSDHGWGDADMQAMDNLDAYIARHEANRAAMLAAQDSA